MPLALQTNGSFALDLPEEDTAVRGACDDPGLRRGSGEINAMDVCLDSFLLRCHTEARLV